jgi:hypothetical protein
LSTPGWTAATRDRIDDIAAMLANGGAAGAERCGEADGEKGANARPDDHWGT